MATIIEFNALKSQIQAQSASLPQARNYSIDISAYPGDYLEFTAHQVKTDPRALCQIADELEKIASIIRSDVISKFN
jgi:hypothetical protein